MWDRVTSKYVSISNLLTEGSVSDPDSVLCVCIRSKYMSINNLLTEGNVSDCVIQYEANAKRIHVDWYQGHRMSIWTFIDRAYHRVIGRETTRINMPPCRSSSRNNFLLLALFKVICDPTGK